MAVDDGGDPAAERRAGKLAAQNEPIQTFGDLAKAYCMATEDGLCRPRRPSSLTNEYQVYRVHIAPALAKVPPSAEMRLRRDGGGWAGSLRRQEDSGGSAWDS